MPDKTYKIVDVVGVFRRAFIRPCATRSKRPARHCAISNGSRSEHPRSCEFQGRAGVPGDPQDRVSSRRRSESNARGTRKRRMESSLKQSSFQ